MIGLGRFGRSVAGELMRRGWDVLGVDADVGVVQRVGEELTQVVAADCTDPAALAQLGVGEFSRVVVGIGTDLEASILTTSNLVDAGVAAIWVRATTRQHGQILERIGAHHIVLPEHDMGERVAHLVTGRMLDFIAFDSDYALIKTLAPKVVGGIPLGESRVRSTYGVTVVGIKRPGADFTHATARRSSIPATSSSSRAGPGRWRCSRSWTGETHRRRRRHGLDIDGMTIQADRAAA
ncbi:potassium channel family protein [Streptomyces sp. INA 01156]